MPTLRVTIWKSLYKNIQGLRKCSVRIMVTADDTHQILGMRKAYSDFACVQTE